MSVAARPVEQAREIAAEMVAKEQRACGSRMTAYEIVARRIGGSPSWLRKLIGRQPVSVKPHILLKLAGAENVSDTPTALATRMRALLDRQARLAAECAALEAEAADVARLLGDVRSRTGAGRNEDAQSRGV